METELNKSRSVFEWIRQLLGRHEKDLVEAGEPPSQETVEKLIDKAVTGKLPASEEEGEDEGAAKPAEGEKPPEDEGAAEPAEGKESCPYAVKRNIVESLRAIREFAERHNLAETMLRALLTLLAEMAVGAMKGKVGEKALEALLKALTFQQYADEAYLRGRNESIEREYFPTSDDIPHFSGFVPDGDTDEENIFNVAREA